ncbi:GNAT family N-acetyltransferase [Xenorhabdus kozodoii]|uniref:N-acetyltransferase n=1 Tax=Xenorhabdus kozodoii TaxID=351676 RepID=A0A2D0LFG9_9GAMM|nr:GNAT family N-acetyltransferase [Xenorhabdus kozodoii]PHM74365.1 N-acetyltransferase [Xenorhabdus kozodoii]
MPNREEEHNAIAETDYHPAIIMEEKLYPTYQAKIKEVNQHDMLSALNEIQTNESSWSYQSTIGAIFNNRHAIFCNIYRSIKGIFDSENVIGGLQVYRHFICSCLISGKVVGIIIFNPAKSNIPNNNVDQIAFILTYPNGYGYGGLLVQHVVNISLESDHKGILNVRAEHDAEIFYQKLGFNYIKSNNFLSLKQMSLDPDTSDKWHRINGKYQLKRIPRPRNTNWQCHLL